MGDVELAQEGTTYPLRAQANDIQCIVADRTGLCRDRSNDIQGILFADGYLLQEPNDFSEIQALYKTRNEDEGKMSYRGRSYLIRNGQILFPGRRPESHIFQSGQLFFPLVEDIIKAASYDQKQQKWIIDKADLQKHILQGWSHTYPGLAVELGAVTYLDTLPDHGIVRLRGQEFEVRHGLLIDPQFNVVLGTINSRGEVSYVDGRVDDLRAHDDVDIALAETSGTTPLQLIRHEGITRYGRQHMVFPNGMGSQDTPAKVMWLGFTLSVLPSSNILRASIAIRPLGTSHQTDHPRWLQELSTRMTRAVQFRLANRFDLRPHPNISDPRGLADIFTNPDLHRDFYLDFAVQAVSSNEDLEVQVYHDDNCWMSTALPCHTVRPATNYISDNEIHSLWPHEMLHYLGARDEYPEPGRELDRPCITGPKSIMFNNARGHVQAWHLEGIRRTAEQLLGMPLQLTPNPSVDPATFMAEPECVSKIQPNF